MLFCELGHIAALLQLALKRLKLGAALQLAHHLLKARADQPRVVNTRITRRRACRRPIGKSLIGLAADAGGGCIGVYADFFKCLGYLVAFCRHAPECSFGFFNNLLQKSLHLNIS